MKHIDQILKKLAIENLASEIGSWHYIPPKKSRETDAQIDLLIDRIDSSINICEIKFSNNQYSIDKNYARNLHNKVKNPGPQDLVWLLPHERGLYNILCNSASCWSNGVLE